MDFGTLSIPADNRQDYNKDVTFEVKATGDNVNASTCVNGGTFTTHGYELTSFTVKDQVMTGTLRFMQRQLYGQKLADIAGDYSGYMVFFSAVEPKTTI